MNARSLLLAFLLIVSPFTAAHQRLLLATVPAAPASICAHPDKAAQAALDSARASARIFCRSQGFGWRAWAIQRTGTLECRSCGDDGLRCTFPTIEVKCERQSVQPTSLIHP